MFTNWSPFSTLMYTMMISSSLMAMSSNNWLMTWMALEINMLSFIPVMNNSNKFQESEAMLKYFLAQALGSSLLLMMSSALWSNIHINKSIIMFILLMSLIIKLGMVPCHMWFPSVMSSLSWVSCMILSTWQKLAPLSIMMFMMKMPYMFMSIPCINALIGAMMGMNQTKLKTIMAFSSITHMGWMSSFMLPNKPAMSIMYLIMYSIITIPLFMIMYMNFLSTNINKSKTSIMHTSLTISFLLLSLSGIPPLLGFFPKWMTIISLIKYPTIILLLMMGAMMNLFFYLNILFSTMLNTNTQWNSSNKQLPPTLIIMATLTLPTMLFSIM